MTLVNCLHINVDWLKLFILFIVYYICIYYSSFLKLIIGIKSIFQFILPCPLKQEEQSDWKTNRSLFCLHSMYHFEAC